MALLPSQAQFEARQLKNGGRWYVLVTWTNGSTAQVNDFAKESEAEQWIKVEIGHLAEGATDGEPRRLR